MYLKVASSVFILISAQLGWVESIHVGGGSTTTLRSYPWTALLVYGRSDSPDEKFFECGGSLISERYVLTVAHCVHNLNDSFALNYVRLGEWDLLQAIDCDEWGCIDPPIDVGVERIIKHSNFSLKTFRNDIALVKMNKSVTFSNTIRPLLLPTIDIQKALIKSQEINLTAVGWGTTEHRNGTKHFNSRYKTKLSMPLITTKTCQQHYTRKLLNSQLCAGGEFGKDTCEGDSGIGLVYVKNFTAPYIIGIVSYGHKYCDLGIPGVYTKVIHFLDWIQDNINQFNPITVVSQNITVTNSGANRF